MKTFNAADKHCVIKVFPHHTRFAGVSDLENILIEHAVDAEILVRRNFTAQLKSICVAREYDKSIGTDIADGKAHTWQDHFSEPFVIEKIDHDMLTEARDRLVEELTHLSRIQQQYGFAVTYLEDVENNYTHLQMPVGKLHRPVIWGESFPEQTFGTERLFQ
jgi:hypothetical protein